MDDQQVRSELGLDPDSKLVGMIGRLDEQKNPLDFIRAAAIVAKNYSKVQFLIIGDGSLRPDCERLINELNLKDQFILLGFRNDVARILPILTMTAMSSLWEGLPLAFIQAMIIRWIGWLGKLKPYIKKFIPLPSRVRLR